MRKILVLAIVMLISTACSAKPSNHNESENNTAYNYLDNIDKDSIQYAGVDGDFAYDISDPNKLRENATNIFIAKVESIDSATCNLTGYEYSPIPYTLGKLNVLQNYIGNANNIINFSRIGGTVTMEEYDRNAPSSAVEKRRYLQEKQKTIKANYMSVTFNGDIELSAGQEYLFYANYNETYDRYEILGFEYGSRKIEGFDSNTRSNSDQATILNNKTGEKENFDTYVENYLK